MCHNGSKKSCWHLSLGKADCSSCGHDREWESQPFMKNIPAGNILLSASILFAGASPTKALHIMDCLGCASITVRTFLNHQRHYLHPTVLSLWKQHQSTILTQLREENRPLVLGCDGRADSPGHSAKFGAYTVMDLVKKAVIDIQVVQVQVYSVCCRDALNPILICVTHVSAQKYIYATE